MWRSLRFIPACAGNTSPPLACTAPFAVHPRVCGEHCACLHIVYRVAGSSPRVRGTPNAGRASQRAVRFIPACAGNTGGLGLSVRVIPVHPRVCGEHEGTQQMPNGMYGSSPRVRGTRYFPCANKQPSRFIPACAGNTEPSAPYSVDVPVHPRVCGEHTSRADTEALKAGSSPRVRGTRRSRWLFHSYRRFIPACAGNTSLPLRVCRNSPVHPRVCGEHPSRKPCKQCFAGSSPRVRGTRRLLCQNRYQGRFIPACAGNTL